MEKLRKFNTEEEFLNIKNSLEYPHVCYTDDTKNVWVKRDKVKLITFTIDGTKQYTAEEGMTWGEWLTSVYNVGGFTADGPNSTIELCYNECGSNNFVSYMSKYIDAYEDELIIPNFNYEHVEMSESFGNLVCDCDF